MTAFEVKQLTRRLTQENYDITNKLFWNVHCAQISEQILIQFSRKVIIFNVRFQGLALHSKTKITIKNMSSKKYCSKIFIKNNVVFPSI